MNENKAGDALEPDPEHLVELMRSAVREREAMRQPGLRAAAQVAQEYTWETVTDRLVARLLPS